MGHWWRRQLPRRRRWRRSGCGERECHMGCRGHLVGADHVTSSRKSLLHLPGALTSQECSSAKADAAQSKWRSAEVSSPLLSHVRRGAVSFIQGPSNLRDRLIEAATRAQDECGWGFVITHWSPVQICRYRPGNFYDWHVDSSFLAQPPVRKITAVADLGGEFVGGGLFIESRDTSVLQGPGDIAVFPAFLRHKAAVVESGERLTAVVWGYGPAFV